MSLIAIRPAKRFDMGAVLTMLKPYLAGYPLKPDPDRIAAVALELHTSAQHYARVAVKDDEVVGCMLAISNENLWAQRKHAHVIGWVSASTGAGVKLLVDFASWVTSRRAVKVAGFTFDTKVDERIYRLVERAGFARHGQSFLLYN